MTLWLKVTSDKYELPLVVADSVQQLAKKCGCSINTVYSSMAYAKITNGKTQYVKVEVEEDD